MIKQVEKPGRALYRMNSALVVGYPAWAKFQSWLVRTHYGELSQEEKDKLRNYPPDAIRAISYWAEAKDMEHIIDTMPEEQKAQELEVRITNTSVFGTENHKDKSFDDLVSDEISHEAWIIVTDKDETYGPVLREVLDRQLKEALDEWQSLIEGGYNESYEMYSDADEFCDRRDVLEYVAASIEILRLEDHLEDLPYYDEFVKRLKELDTPFRKLLNGETFPKPYADKTFWWRQK